jgi:hypothetical protein
VGTNTLHVVLDEPNAGVTAGGKRKKKTQTVFNSSAVIIVEATVDELIGQRGFTYVCEVFTHQRKAENAQARADPKTRGESTERVG